MRLLESLVVISVCSYYADGVRMKRAQKTAVTLKGAKFLAGVPILNYHLSASKTAGAGDEEWILVVKPEVTDEEVHKMCSKLNCLREGHPNKGGVPYFEVRSTEAQLETLLSATGSMIKFVERDGEVRNVPDIHEVTTSSSASWGLDRIGAPSRSTTGIGVHVYVLDTGLLTTHSDFGGRAISTVDMSSESLVECKGATGCAVDRQGHGTHCAGSATGTTYGVAPGAGVHGIKVLGDNGSGSWSWSIEAMDWLVLNAERPSVASMSLGGSGNSPAMANAVDRCVAAGIVVVVAGGNENTDACTKSPAFVPSAITVGSTNQTDLRSRFSNYGSCTDIWAPGHSITSAGIASNDASETYSGTSMACPHVSGGAALLLEASRDLSPDEVLEDLISASMKDTVKDLKCGDVNFLLHVGAGSTPVTDEPQPAPVCVVPYVCSDGCPVNQNWLNDNYCDCSDCGDEEAHTCDSCGGCPTQCGAYIRCSR